MAKPTTLYTRMAETVYFPDDVLHQTARFMVTNCLGGIMNGDRVCIMCEAVAEPLALAIETAVFAQGGYAEIVLLPRNHHRRQLWSTTAIAHLSPAALRMPPRHRTECETTFTKFIGIMGEASPGMNVLTDPAYAEAMTAASEAHKPISDRRMQFPWCLTLFPTPAYAADEGMTLQELCEAWQAVMTADYTDDFASARKLAAALTAAKTVRIRTVCPQRGELNLELDISEANGFACTGQLNFPDGEAMTSPHSQRGNGEIFIDQRLMDGGQPISGIWFKVRGGRIVEFDAREGLDILTAKLGVDEGARRFGEFAFGVNRQIDLNWTNALFWEKPWGTCHITPGSAYDYNFNDPAAARASGAFNQSAEHLDLVFSARPATDTSPAGCCTGIWLDDQKWMPDPDTKLWVPVG